jgi:hypothetical protein
MTIKKYCEVSWVIRYENESLDFRSNCVADDSVMQG